MKILVIEDEIELQNIIKTSLLKEQYTVEVASDYYAAQEKITIYDYDCILLDIMLPNGSGMNLLQELKKMNKSGSVIIISAKNSVSDKIKGLELGADDYLTKPFHIAELTARIKAVIRRNNLDGKNYIELGNIVLHTQDRTLTINGNLIHLNRKEFDILYYFLLNKNRLITKTALAEYVWGDHIDESDNFDFIYYQIKNLRKKLDNAEASIIVDTIYGIGYKLSEK
ncbi:response regulator transcription factor [Winogradskyella costae]|uniref:response regulator transcription factor n=1 Tax=Winogradskyella costae TaxID=2697008 RepID=UPI0015CC24BD|nr:response regulator transcription factor [Winogradskyella costae]